MFIKDGLIVGQCCSPRLDVRNLGGVGRGGGGCYTYVPEKMYVPVGSLLALILVELWSSFLESGGNPLG